jgi:hypothetical protein
MARTLRIAFAVALGLAVIWILAGCSEDKESSIVASQSGTDEEALAQMMTGDEEIESLDAWAGEDDAALENGGSLDETVDPIHWGRIGHRLRERVTVEIQGDTLATITRTCAFNGVFRLVTDTTGGTRTVVDKRMFNVIVRKAHAVRVGHAPRPRLNWRITEITPDVLTSAAPNPNTVWPVNTRFYRMVSGTPELIAEVSDPLNTYFSRENLPTLAPGEELIVRMRVNVAGEVVAVLHPRVFMVAPNPRLYLHDDGVAPDETAGDGVWSGSYTVGNRMGVFMAGTDVINWLTVHDTEAPYDATGWAIPYRVFTSPQ